MKHLLFAGFLLSSVALAQAPQGFIKVKGALWGYVVQKDQMTGENTSWAVSPGIEDSDAMLMIACVNKNPEILFYPASLLGITAKNMWFKFDNRKVVGPFEYMQMQFDGDNMAAVPRNLRPHFLNSMKTAKKVMLRTYDLRGQQKTYSFHVPGALTALKNMSNCK